MRNAEWSGGVYVVHPNEVDDTWISEDGDEWRDQDGALCSSQEFYNENIRLNGGPRDGEMVS